MGTGAYDIPAYEAEIITVFTNKVPQGAYRGAGRPEAAYLIERCMNVVARTMKLDPVRIRQLNYIRKEQFPFKTKSGRMYDSGDYDTNMRKALQVSNYQSLLDGAEGDSREGAVGRHRDRDMVGDGGDRPWQRPIRSHGGERRGRHHTHLRWDPSGPGPRNPVLADRRGRARGRYGQGEDELRRHSDAPWSSMTAGSRSGPVTGSAVYTVAGKVRAKMAKIAAHMLKLPEGTSLVFADGRDLPGGQSWGRHRVRRR